MMKLRTYKTSTKQSVNASRDIAGQDINETECECLPGYCRLSSVSGTVLPLSGNVENEPWLSVSGAMVFLCFLLTVFSVNSLPCPGEPA